MTMEPMERRDVSPCSVYLISIIVFNDAAMSICAEKVANAVPAGVVAVAAEAESRASSRKSEIRGGSIR